jgi:hypothetical protein
MHLVIALASMIGPAPTADLIGTWQGPAIVYLVSKRGWGPGDKDAEFPDPASLLFVEHPPPNYLDHALIRCHSSIPVIYFFSQTANTLGHTRRKKMPYAVTQRSPHGIEQSLMSCELSLRDGSTRPSCLTASFSHVPLLWR